MYMHDRGDQSASNLTSYTNNLQLSSRSSVAYVRALGYVWVDLEGKAQCPRLAALMKARALSVHQCALILHVLQHLHRMFWQLA